MGLLIKLLLISIIVIVNSTPAKSQLIKSKATITNGLKSSIQSASIMTVDSSKLRNSKLRFKNQPLEKEHPELSNFEEWQSNKTTRMDRELVENKIEEELTMTYIIKSNNQDQSTPLDNAVATSGNHTVTITNDVMEIYEDSTIVNRTFLEDLIEGNLQVCDPRAVYDVLNERFVILFQSGLKSDSKLIIGFSKTPNPLDGWNIYKIPGNIKENKNVWFDYPKLSLGKNQLIVTGNLFEETLTGDSFIESIVFQFDLRHGYQGLNLINYVYWTSLHNAPFTLQPICDAQRDEAYLISTNYENGSDFFKIYHLTSSLSDTCKVSYYEVPVSPTRDLNYNFFYKAWQKGNQTIETGDIRIMDGFIKDSTLFFCFTSGDWNRTSKVNLNALHLPTLQNKSVLLSLRKNISYAFPSMTLVYPPAADPYIFVLFNYTSFYNYPSVGWTKCNLKLECDSPDKLLVEGEGEIMEDSQGIRRWGDYTTAVKSPLLDGQVWAGASVGIKANKDNVSRQSVLIKLDDDKSIPSPKIVNQSMGSSMIKLPKTANLLMDAEVLSDKEVFIKNNIDIRKDSVLYFYSIENTDATVIFKDSRTKKIILKGKLNNIHKN